MSDELVQKRVIVVEEWMHPRKGVITEVTHPDGRLRYHVDATDLGRDRPFVHQEFAQEEAARNFLYDKLMVKEV